MNKFIIPIVTVLVIVGVGGYFAFGGKIQVPVTQVSQPPSVSVSVQQNGGRIDITNGNQVIGTISTSSLPIISFGKAGTVLSGLFVNAWVISNQNKILFEYVYPGTEAQNTQYYFGIANADGSNAHDLKVSASNVGNVVISGSGKYFAYLSGFHGGFCQNGVTMGVYDLDEEKSLNIPDALKGWHLGSGEYNVLSDISWQSMEGEESLKITDSPYVCDKIPEGQQQRNLPVKNYVLTVPGMVLNEATSNISTSTSTSDWQTYMNNQYGFEVKYPQYLVATMPENANVVNPNVVYIVDPTQGKPDTDQPADRLLIKINPGTKCALKDWEKGFGDIYWKTACVDGNPNYFVIMSALTGESQKVLDQILSTFKFVSP